MTAVTYEVIFFSGIHQLSHLHAFVSLLVDGQLLLDFDGRPLSLQYHFHVGLR